MRQMWPPWHILSSYIVWSRSSPGSSFYGWAEYRRLINIAIFPFDSIVLVLSSAHMWWSSASPCGGVGVERVVSAVLAELVLHRGKQRIITYERRKEPRQCYQRGKWQYLWGACTRLSHRRTSRGNFWTKQCKKTKCVKEVTFAASSYTSLRRPDIILISFIIGIKFSHLSLTSLLYHSSSESNSHV
jgi:hypothetical protein